jgi:hypothetical protein
VIAHEMLANRPLFAAGSDQETIQRVCNMPIPPPSAVNPRVPEEVDGLVLTALARDPAHRWQYAAVFRDAISAGAQRLGVDIGPMQIAAWLAAPQPAPPQPAAPPAPPAPQVWQDDDDEATRMQDMDPATFVPPAPAAAAEPEPVPEPAPEPPPPTRPQRLPTAIESEIGPEPTNIGAMPLVSFGQTGSMNALVGEARQSATSLASQAGPLPAASVTYLRDEQADRRRRRRKQLLIAGVSLVVLAGVILALVL